MLQPALAPPDPWRDGVAAERAELFDFCGSSPATMAGERERAEALSREVLARDLEIPWYR